MSYKAGTVTTVVNNATITGTNTQWANTLYNVVKGQIIVITQGTNTDIYTIEEIKSNTSLLLSRPAVRATSNATYEILTTLNNSVSDDTIKLGNEIVAMGDFMRIMQAWTTGTGDTITVTWGSQQITIASVAGLQKQIDSKISGQAIGISDGTDILAYFAAGDKTSGPYSTGGAAVNGPVSGIHTYYWTQRQKGYGTLEAKSISGGQLWINGLADGKWRGWMTVLSGSGLTQVTEGEIRTRRGIGAWDADNKNALMTSVVRGRPDFYMMKDGRVWTPQLPETNGLLLPQRYEGTDAVPMWRVIGSSGTNAGWVRIATVGEGTTSSQNSRYLFTLVSTAAGYGGGGSTAYGTLVVTILNGQGSNANQNFDVYFAATAYHGTDCPVRIKQINAWQAEIWLRIGSYSQIVASCVTLDSFSSSITSAVTSDANLPIVSNGTASTYEANVYRKYATSAGVVLDVGASFNWGENSISGPHSAAVIGKVAAGSWASWAARAAFVEVHSTSTNGASSIFKLKSSAGVPLLAFGGYSTDGTSANVQAQLAWGANSMHFSPNTVTFNCENIKVGTNHLMKVGDYGIGASRLSTDSVDTVPISDFNNADYTGFYKSDDATANAKYPYSPMLNMTRRGGSAGFGFRSQLQIDTFSGALSTRGTNGNNWSAWRDFYTTANTTKDTNGNLKAASPVVQIFKDKIVCNDESKGVEMERLGVGKYLIKNVLGLNSDPSWGGIHGGIVIPKGINDLNLFWADYKVLADGNILLTTNYRKYSDLPPQIVLKRLTTYPEFMDENGNELESYAPCDIPNGHCVDMRVQMPENSIYNVKARAQQNAMFYSSLVDYQQEILQNQILQLN